MSDTIDSPVEPKVADFDIAMGSKHKHKKHKSERREKYEGKRHSYLTSASV